MFSDQKCPLIAVSPEDIFYCACQNRRYSIRLKALVFIYNFINKLNIDLPEIVALGCSDSIMGEMQHCSETVSHGHSVFLIGVTLEGILLFKNSESYVIKITLKLLKYV